ncbi:MAG: glycosyltransferase family 2 protein [Litorimonas sp.]
MGSLRDRSGRSGTARAIPIGRADQLRPLSGVASGGIASLLAGLIGIEIFTAVQVSELLIGLSLAMTWLTVALTCFRGLSLFVQPRPSPALLSDALLPTYTVFVPVFREAHMIPALVTGLSAANYPMEKLDIIFICEQSDRKTVEAAQSASGGAFRTLVVPPPVPGGEPQTKPRALNYALERSNGELVTIYDAEDRPHPDQLRQAASALATRPDWAAVQAPLQYYNTSDTALAAQFAMEYDGLFRVLLPFYDRLGLPFPLGGTSNHMRRSAVERVGGWDAFNVTEDADLAFQLAGERNGIGWIDAPTLEEAVSTFRPWVRQRSRWLKGFMATWRVHARHPLARGWRRGLMLHLTVGATLLSIPFYAPVLFYLVAHSVAWMLGIVDQGTPSVYLWTLGFSAMCNMAVGALGAVRAGRPDLLRHVPFMPLYWLLLLPPFYQAAVEMRTRPFHWHKTEHGVTDAPL